MRASAASWRPPMPPPRASADRRRGPPGTGRARQEGRVVEEKDGVGDDVGRRRSATRSRVKWRRRRTHARQAAPRWRRRCGRELLEGGEAAHQAHVRVGVFRSGRSNGESAHAPEYDATWTAAAVTTPKPKTSISGPRDAGARGRDRSRDGRLPRRGVGRAVARRYATCREPRSSKARRRGSAGRRSLNKRDGYRAAVRRLDPEGRALRRARGRGADRRPAIVRNRLKIAVGDRERAAASSPCRRTRLPRRRLLGLRGRHRRAATVPRPSGPPSTPESDALSSRLQAPRLQASSEHDYVRVHAGRRPGERPRARLLQSAALKKGRAPASRRRSGLLRGSGCYFFMGAGGALPSASSEQELHRARDRWAQ